MLISLYIVYVYIFRAVQWNYRNDRVLNNELFMCIIQKLFFLHIYRSISQGFFLLCQNTVQSCRIFKDIMILEADCIMYYEYNVLSNGYIYRSWKELVLHYNLALIK